MDEQISAQPRTIVGELSPAEEALRVERPLGRILEKSIPIDGLRARVRRNGVDPCPARRIAVEMRIDRVHLAHSPRSINLRGLSVENRADPLAAGLEDSLAGLDSFHHRKSVGHIVRHRLLAIDVLARRHGIQRHAPVMMVRSGDKNCFHIVAVQQGPVVARGGNILAPRLLCRLVPCHIQVRRSHANTGGHISRRPQQVAPANPGSHNRKTYPAARLGSHRPRLQQRRFHCRSRGNGARAQPHKLPPCHRR